MKITDVKVRQLKNPKNNVLGFADVTFDEILVVKNFRIVHGRDSLFVGMPSKRGVDGQFYPEVFYIGAQNDGTPGQEASRAFQSAVLKTWADSTKPEFEDQTQQAQPTNMNPVSNDNVPF